MGVWTLEYDGSEKLLADWGIAANCPFQFASQAADSVLLRTMDDFDAPFRFTAGEKCVLRRDRAVAGSVFSGGSIFFQGYVSGPSRDTSAGTESHGYTLLGPWSMLELCQLQQARRIFNGFTDPDDPNSEPTFRTVFDSSLTLGEDINETPLHSGAQIEALLAWANECWNPTRRGTAGPVDPLQDLLQIGTIGVAAPVPKYPVRDMKVGEAIQQMLRWTQDAIAWFDYTTVPPTFHVAKSATLPVVTLLTDEVKLTQMHLEARYDRMIPGVIIRYNTSKEVNGMEWKDVVPDKYPLSLSDYDPKASVHTIDLLGSSLTTHEGRLDCEPCLPATTDWWKENDPTLKSAEIADFALIAGTLKVLNKAGEEVSLAAYPYTLEDGNVAAWMRYNGAPIEVVHVTIKAECAITKISGGTVSRNIEISRKAISCRKRLTNAVSGIYSSQEFTAGEAVPTGLAQSMYEGFSTLQYEGQPTLVADEVPGLAMGTSLTITTPALTIAGLLVQGISGDLASGTISPQLGPPAQVGLTDMIEMLRVNRRRLTFNLPSRRSTGKVNGSNRIQLGDSTAKENTTTEVLNRSLLAIEKAEDSPGTTVARVENDAINKKIVIEVKAASGERDTSHGSVELKLDDTLGTDGQKHAVKLQQVLVCIQGNRLAAIASISDLFDPEAPTP